jgi:hypothetical protein
MLRFYVSATNTRLGLASLTSNIQCKKNVGAIPYLHRLKQQRVVPSNFPDRKPPAKASRWLAVGERQFQRHPLKHSAGFVPQSESSLANYEAECASTNCTKVGFGAACAACAGNRAVSCPQLWTVANSRHASDSSSMGIIRFITRVPCIYRLFQGIHRRDTATLAPAPRTSNAVLQ